MSENTTQKTDSSRDAAPDIPAVKLIRAIDGALGRVEQVLLCAFLVILVSVGVGQAVATHLGASWAWSHEIIRYSVFFIAMTGAALSAHTQQLIAMDFVTRMLSARARARLTIVLRVFTIAICVLLVVGGLVLRDVAGDSLYHLIAPQTGLLALPIGASLMAVHVSLHTIIDVLHMRHGVLRSGPPRSGH